LEEAVKIDDALHPYVEEGQDAAIQLEELALTLGNYAESVEFRPDRLAEVEERLEALGELKRKYGETEEGIQRYGEQAQQELAALETDESSAEEMGAEIDELKRGLQDEALQLSRKRQAVARRLEREIVALLRTLHMPRVQFFVALRHLLDPTGFVRRDADTVALFPTGVDQVEFTFSPNVGEEAKPLARIASGGELSRVMLAMKAILAEHDSIPTLVFDEVDSGIGCETAEVVGATLLAVAGSHQVFCITHLPQIASKGQAHYLIYKEVHRRRTRTRFKRMSDSERVDEIARMSGGKVITEATRRLAEEMLRGG
jgi:DNA repair protein RecN (Recombination protein N)